MSETTASTPAQPRKAAAALRPSPPKSRTPPSPAEIREQGELTRRAFVWHGVAGFLTVLTICFARFFFPRTLFEPKTKFTIGYPSEYGFGVDTKWQQKYRIWVVRGASGLYVIHAVCTHLGCTPDWKPAENKFKCPCHGSGFDTEGINYEGPAPKPMLRCHLALDPTGQIIVDTLDLYNYDTGAKTFKGVPPSESGPLLAV